MTWQNQDFKSDSEIEAETSLDFRHTAEAAHAWARSLPCWLLFVLADIKGKSI